MASRYPIDPEEHPSLQRMTLGVAAIVNEPHNHDDTMQFAFTHRELATVIAGLNLIALIHPELGGVTVELIGKIEDVSAAQRFLPQGGE